MVANDTQAFDNNIAVRDAIANGEIDVGLINHYYVAEAVAEEGPDYPVGVFFPPGGDPGALVNVAGAAILESSGKHARGAEASSRYLLSKRGQEYFADETRSTRSPPASSPTRARAAGEIEQPRDRPRRPRRAAGDRELIQESGAL